MRKLFDNPSLSSVFSDEPWNDATCRVLKSLVDSNGHGYEPSVASRDGELVHLHTWVTLVRVVCRRTQGDGKVLWALTDKGKARLGLGRAIVNPKPLLVPRPMLVQAMVAYELRCALEDNGWQCCIAASTADRRLARDTPCKLTDGDESSPQRWWVSRSQASQGSGGVINNLLNLLLTAIENGVAVPHLVSAGVYAKMIGPSWEPKHKRVRQAFHWSFEGADWD